MLYSKYVIEAVCEIEVVIDFSTILINPLQIHFDPLKHHINVIKFVSLEGYISEFPVIYNTYEEAFNILSNKYYKIRSNYNVLSVSIKEIYDDLEPPVEIMRRLKLNKVLKR